MLKLLLPHKEKTIKKIYTLRVFVFILYAVAIILFYYAISFAPSILIARSERTLLKEQIEIVKDPELNKDKVVLREKILSVARTINLLDDTNYEISSIINSITENQLPAISITSIQFEGDVTEDETLMADIDVQGVSADRGSLGTYVERLQQEQKFKTVTLPFSSFTRGVDVPFAISIEMLPVYKNLAEARANAEKRNEDN